MRRTCHDVQKTVGWKSSRQRLAAAETWVEVEYQPLGMFFETGAV